MNTMKNLIDNFEFNNGIHTINSVSVWHRTTDDNITYKADGEWVTVSGEFYVNKKTAELSHTHIFDDGLEVEIKGIVEHYAKLFGVE